MKRKHLALVGALATALVVAAAGGYAAFTTLARRNVVVETTDPIAVADGWIAYVRPHGTGRLELVRRPLDGGEVEHLDTASPFVWTVAMNARWALWSWRDDSQPSVRLRTHAVELATGEVIDLGPSLARDAALAGDHAYLIDRGLLRHVELPRGTVTDLEPAVAVATDDSFAYAVQDDALLRWRHGDPKAEIVARGFACGSDLAVGGEKVFVTTGCRSRGGAILEVDPNAATWRRVLGASEPRFPVWIGDSLVFVDWIEADHRFAILQWAPGQPVRPVTFEGHGPIAHAGHTLYVPIHADRIVRRRVDPYGGER